MCSYIKNMHQRKKINVLAVPSCKYYDHDASLFLLSIILKMPPIHKLTVTHLLQLIRGKFLIIIHQQLLRDQANLVHFHIIFQLLRLLLPLGPLPHHAVTEPPTLTEKIKEMIVPLVATLTRE